MLNLFQSHQSRFFNSLKFVLITLLLLTVSSIHSSVSSLEPAQKSSKKAIRAFSVAYKYYKAGKLDKAIENFQSFLENYEADPLAKKAKEYLRESGQGDDIRVVLNDRKIMRNAFKMPEPKVLELAEKELEGLEKLYKGLEPCFESPELWIYFYDSQARYRKETKHITSGGLFSVKKSNLKEGELTGQIQWYIPRQGGNKDRSVRARAVIIHEGSHYMNKIHFGQNLPSLFEEGIATHNESRLNTDFYATTRVTVRQRYEAEARNGLGAIASLKGFKKFLNSQRGFGKGDRMITRWYSYCYAMVDCLAEGKKWETPSSMGEVFSEISKLALKNKEAQLKKKRSTTQATLRSATTLLEHLVKTIHGSDLKTFHQHLVHHIKTNYKQR